MRIGGARFVVLAAVALAATGQAWAGPVAINDASQQQKQQQQQLLNSGGDRITKHDGAGFSVVTSVDGQLSVDLTVAPAAKQVRSEIEASMVGSVF